MVEEVERELLISRWFPISEISVESVRERTPGTPYPATSRIHVWFARKPLATSRGAVLGSLLPAEVNHEDFLKLMGIPIGVDVQKAENEVARARAVGKRTERNPFFWEKAFRYTPSAKELLQLHELLKKTWNTDKPLVVDPMAGGGSILFEAMRLGLPVIGGDLNPVAFVCLKSTLEYPSTFGRRLLPAVEDFCSEVHEAARTELDKFFPNQAGEKVYAYLWARTLSCPSCGLIVPLSPNWWIVNHGKSEKSYAIKVVLPDKGNTCIFEIVQNPLVHGLTPEKGTVRGGQGECPRCYTVMSGENIKNEIKNGRMGQQLYCVCAKNKSFGKNRSKWTYRNPTKQEIDVINEAGARINEKLLKWKKLKMVPEEVVPDGLKTRELINFGMTSWYELFSPRQLLTHLTYLEKFLEIKEKILAQSKSKDERDFMTAVITYGAIVFDTNVDYNSLLARWHTTRSQIANSMSLQAFPFKWSYAEWNQLVPGGGYEWALHKVLEAVKELVAFLPEKTLVPRIYCGTATKIPLEDASVPCIIVDPPYAENVMYAEVSDFFYVWLKRLIGDLFPEAFKTILTEKEEEAVANPARFKNAGKSAKILAQRDYETKMQAAFKEMFRVLREDGIMTIMFTHRTAEAWSSLTTALMNAGFTFVSSWPVHTEPPEKFGKRDKGVLKVTVLLTCRKRKADNSGIWEQIIDELIEIAKSKIEEFSKLGVEGPDLKVSVYAPVLGKFANYYPVKTATGKEIDPQQALDLVTDVLNERFLQEAGIQNADKETAAYINLLATFPTAETEYEEARLATVFGGLVTLDALDAKGSYGLVEKKGKAIKILSARDRQAMGIIDPHDPKTLKTVIDYVQAAILQYERGGLVQVKRLIQDKNLDIAGSPFPTVLQAYARYADNSTNENFQKDAAMAKALLAALGKSIEFAPKKGERLDHYTSES